MLSTKKRLLICLIFAACLAGIPLRSENSSRNLAQAGSEAEAQGYFNLAAHYYHHSLKSGGDASVKEALARVLAKRKEAAATGGLSGAQPAARSEVALARGSASWSDGEPRADAKALNNFNLATPRGQRVKYVFAPSGALSARDGQVGMEFRLDRALILADVLLGEARVYASLKVRARSMSDASPAEWEKAAQSIAKSLSAEDRCAGLLLELDGDAAPLLALAALIKKGTPKPVGLSVRASSPVAFRWADFLVVRAPASASAMKDELRGLLEGARKEGGKVLVSCEASGLEPLQAALGLSVLEDDTAFLGVVLPASAPEAAWERMKLPLERP